MIPRAPKCDDDRCDYDTTGWVHDPGCRYSRGLSGDDDMATATAHEDGYSRAYRVAAPVNAFGHEPEEFCGQTVCRRCGTVGELTPGYTVRDLVPWPCTSALVLGLVARQEARAA